MSSLSQMRKCPVCDNVVVGRAGKIYCNSKCRSLARYYRNKHGQEDSVKTCKADKCGIAILDNNITGYCRSHQYLSDQKRDYDQKYRDSNKDKIRERNREYNEINAEKHRERVSEWQKQNPEKVKFQRRKTQSNRRAVLKKVFLEIVDPQVVWERDNGICCICNEPADPDNWWLEHAVPISKGGEHSYANVFVSHPDCNRKKGAKLGG